MRRIWGLLMHLSPSKAKLHAIKFTFVFLVIAVALLQGFQNCAPVGGVRGQQTINGVHLSSPYSENRVILNSQSFDAKILNSAQEPTLKSGIVLAVAIDNMCASSACANGANANSITCQQFTASAFPSLKYGKQYYEITPPNPMSQNEIEAWSSADPTDASCIRGVTENHVFKSAQTLAFNDTYYSQQQSILALIGFEAAQAYFPAAQLSAVKVGIVDSGIASDPDLSNVKDRQDLRSAASKAASPCPAFSNTSPNNGHGTFVAGIIGATQNNSFGITGIAPNVQLYAYAIGDCGTAIVNGVQETGDSEMSTAEVANGIQAALAEGVDIINMSFGGQTPDDMSVRDAITDGNNDGVLFVAAAGNSSLDIGDHPFYPASYSASYPGFITVAASDPNGDLAPFSNYSAGGVNLTAPGMGVTSIVMGLGYGSGDGTSFAAPMVTAAAALAIGKLRYQNQTLELGDLVNLLTTTGADSRVSLVQYVKNGAYLDLNLIGQQISQTLPPPSLTYTIGSVDLSSGNPVVSVSVTIDLSAAQLAQAIANGDRIGLFDLSSGCNYTNPCLIQDLNFPSTLQAGVPYNFVLQIPRDQVVAMMSSKSDAKALLPLSVALFHPKVAGSLIYNVDAATSAINVRTIDYSSQLTNPKLLGGITNVRTDMQNIYVDGWACYQGSNEAIQVSLQTPTGTPITAGFAYDYEIMFQNPWLDNNGTFFSGQSATQPYAAPFLAPGISISQNNSSHFLAGEEANPQLVAPCQTLTASQGFEFVIPVAQVSAQSLIGNSIQIVATSLVHSQSMTLADPTGRQSIPIPDLNFQPTLTNNMALTRDATALSYSMTGSLCSTSPSPIEVELSMSDFNYLIALFGSFPEQLIGLNPYVNDPTLTGFGFQEVAATSSTNAALAFTPSVLSLTGIATTDPAYAGMQYLMGLYTTYAPNPPNTHVDSAGVWFNDPTLVAQYMANVNQRNFVEVGTTNPVTYYMARQSLAQGSALPSLSTQFTTDRANVSTSFGLSPSWSGIDAGQQFSLNLVGYNINYQSNYPVGSQIWQTYQVTQLLRETKKYETPLSAYTVVLGHANLTANLATGPCPGGFQHYLSSPLVVSNYGQYAPGTSSVIDGFFLKSSPLPSFSPTTQVQAMTTVPITARFFQDGKMILHLESDRSLNPTATPNFTPVAYPFVTPGNTL